MSEILTRITEDFKVYRKIGSKEKAAFAGTLISDIAAKGYTANGKREVTEDEAIAVLKSTEKKLRELLAIPNIPETAKTKAEAELAYVLFVLPQQMDEIAILKAIEHETDFSSAMKMLKEKYAGRYDGKLASTVVKNHFNK